MRTHNAQMQMTCSAVVLQLEGTRHPFLGKALGSLLCSKDRSMLTGPVLHFKLESELHGNGEVGNQPLRGGMDRYILFYVAYISQMLSS